MFDWKKLLWQMLPFSIGLLVGAGFTKNKYVWGILLTFAIVMLVKNAILNPMKGKKKSKVTEAAINWYVETVTDGVNKGNILFDKVYSTWTFVFNIILLIASIYLLYKQYYLWSFISFVSLQLFIVQNQVLRRLR